MSSKNINPRPEPQTAQGWIAEKNDGIYGIIHVYFEQILKRRSIEVYENYNSLGKMTMQQLNIFYSRIFTTLIKGDLQVSLTNPKTPKELIMWLQ